MTNLLLVDDDRDYNVALKALLSRDHHETQGVHLASEALQALRSNSFDVALLDLQLPDGDGLSLISEFAKIDPLMPVICLTGREDTSTVVSAMRRGAVDYLVKPIDRNTLLLAVTSALEVLAQRRNGLGGLRALAPATGGSARWNETMTLVAAAAKAPRTTVLITGESGVGKEIVAGMLHRLSKRSTAPFVTTNAACFNASLMESELFGHESGAFTGANKRHRGLFEQADGGVLFLDEIGELPLELQGKLLRILEGHPFRRVGGEDPITCDVRLICATNRDLPSLVKEGRFKADLLARLRVFEIGLPPLRERREDIPHLALHFVAKLGAEMGYPASTIDPGALDVLSQHEWPGNVRELRNIIERALVLSSGKLITIEHLPPEVGAVSSPTPRETRANGNPSLDALVQHHVTNVFQRLDGNLTLSAKHLGISRLALRKKLKRYGLKPA